MSQKRIVTIQDISCFGRCSLGVAIPIISAAGIECCPLPTAVLSTHTGGFSGYTFRDLSEDIPKISSHWQKEGITFDGIYTGYLGSEAQIDMAADLISKFRTKSSVVMIDPAMADFGKLYTGFDKQFARHMAKLCSVGDIIVPNITEACLITDTPYIENGGEEYILSLLERLKGLGAKQIVLTGVELEHNKLGPIAMDCLSGKIYKYQLSKIDRSYHGTGDVFSAAFFAAIITGQNLESAIKTATDFTHSSIERPYKANTDSRFGVAFEQELADFSAHCKTSQ